MCEKTFDMSFEQRSSIAKRIFYSATADSKTLTMSVSRPYTNATHCGFLMKKGATFKMWKPRWFVLDASRHQVGYSFSISMVSSITN